MAEEIKISGSVEDIIFQNNDNGYVVFTIISNGNESVCVGTVPHLRSGETLNINGTWIVHPTYGKQLSINYFEKTIPTTESAIEKYLSSGVIKNVGPKTAQKIVKLFGEDTFYVIEEQPDRLTEIKGITYEKAKMISDVFREQHALRRVMIFLQDLDISPAYAMRIYKKYRDRTYDIVKTNPYRLADDIFGIGFKMADKLATNTGIGSDSPHRIKSGVKYVLNQAALAGDVYLPQDILMERTFELLNIDYNAIESSIIELQIENQIWQEKIEDEICVYLNSYYYSEIATAKKLLELSSNINIIDDKEIDKLIRKTEGKIGIALAENQKTAVKEAMENGMLVITGGPGTGKTTTINTIIHLLKDEGKEIVLAAPTGRAAKRMTETTGMNAQTIHRLLGISFVNENSRHQVFDKNEDNPIDADVIIIDESSMVDITLMHSLLKAVAVGTKLILVGDVDQLPSVGPGNVLKDIIRSQRLKIVRLTEIFRQAQESAIVMNAHRINNGEEPILNEKEKDFFFVKRAYVEDVANTIVELATKRLPNFNSSDPIRDIQVLTPMRKSPVGVYELNVLLQKNLNPECKSKKEMNHRGVVYRVGDKVMQIKNNYNIVWKVYNELGKRSDEGVGVFNGDEGVIKDIDDGCEVMTVIYDDNKIVDYDFTQLDELELAYAITIHKSQGSEYPVVIVPIHSGPNMLMSRNLLYTAVTRAKSLVVIVGLKDTIKRMVDNNREINRYSSLGYRIKNLYDFMFDK